MRRLNRYVEERAPWQLARDPETAAALDETLASLAEGLRAVSVLLHPYMPGERREAAPGARCARGRRTPCSVCGARERAAGQPLEPLFPKRSSWVIDSHTHLELCEPPDAELVAAAMERG